MSLLNDQSCLAAPCERPDPQWDLPARDRHRYGGGDGGVPDGRLLVAFAEAVLGEDDDALARARDALAAVLGLPGLVDAAGVIGLFNAIDRVADATGIPIEDAKAQSTADIRAALGINAFAESRGEVAGPRGYAPAA